LTAQHISTGKYKKPLIAKLSLNVRNRYNVSKSLLPIQVYLESAKGHCEEVRQAVSRVIILISQKWKAGSRKRNAWVGDKVDWDP